MLVPFIALFFGVYPLVLNRDFALAATLYFTSSSLVTSVSLSGGWARRGIHTSGHAWDCCSIQLPHLLSLREGLSVHHIVVLERFPFREVSVAAHTLSVLMLLPMLCCALQYCRDRKHAKPMWFCVVSCHILWFTFTKAIFNVIKKKITGGRAHKYCSYRVACAGSMAVAAESLPSMPHSGFPAQVQECHTQTVCDAALQVV